MAFSVEFNLKINTLATNYSSHPITFGDPPAAAKWVWTFYVFGQDSDNLNGKLQVWGNTVENKFVPLSPISQVLNLNQTYHIKWSHNKAKGSQLYIDNNLIGTQGYTELNTTLSNSIWLKKNCYNGNGRPHSWFDGDVTNATILRNGQCCFDSAVASGLFLDKLRLGECGDPKDWNVQQVAAWLGSVENGQYARYKETFIENEVDGEELDELDQDELNTAVWSPRFVGTFWANLPENSKSVL
eukprot:340796_1